MANKPLKSVKFPGLGDTYTIPQVDTTLAVTGAAADSKKVGDELTELKADFTQLDETAAKIDGSYDTMTVGNAKQLTSNVGINDKAPYLFRTAGGANDIGDREEDTIVGGSVVWNQLIQNGNFVDETNWKTQQSTYSSLSVSNNVATVTINSGTISAYNPAINQQTFVTTIADHTYMVSFEIKAPLDCKMYVGGGLFQDILTGKPLSANAWTKITAVVKSSTSKQLLSYIGTFAWATTPELGYSISYKNIEVSDLTADFGTTIADYILALESATAGSGIAWLKKYGFFTKDYYPYSAPTFKHVEGLASHKMTGFNQWDEQWEGGAYNTSTGEKSADASRIRSKNPIRVLPNTQYCFTKPSGNATRILYYDENMNFLSAPDDIFTNHAYDVISTPINAAYMNFTTQRTTYANDICINLHWDGERDGEYEAYKEYTYPLDDSLTLRGIPKLDTNNDLYYDGDTYEADGTVTRKYGVIDLSTLTFTYNSNYTNFQATVTGLKENTLNSVCSTYVNSKASSISGVEDKQYYTSGDHIRIKDLAYTDATTFNENVSGVFIYELATPTEETADPFQTPQVVDDWGTEEYVYADGAFPIPVGHDTFYAANLKAKLEMAPDSPGDGDGDYVVRQTNGLNEYVKMVKELPSTPTTDGSYHLEVTVASGTPTLTWVADE